MSKEKWREKTEKIWKLLKLLNEYETPRSWVVYKSYDDYDWFFYWVDCDWETEIAWSDSLICSKKFWWIQWLVENDKIDIDAYKTVYSGDLDKRKTLTMSSGWDEFYQVTEHWAYESLLMLLAIQPEPIEFLISILK